MRPLECLRNDLSRTRSRAQLAGLIAPEARVDADSLTPERTGVTCEPLELASVRQAAIACAAILLSSLQAPPSRP